MHYLMSRLQISIYRNPYKNVQFDFFFKFKEYTKNGQHKGHTDQTKFIDRIEDGQPHDQQAARIGAQLAEPYSKSLIKLKIIDIK